MNNYQKNNYLTIRLAMRYQVFLCLSTICFFSHSMERAPKKTKKNDVCDMLVKTNRDNALTEYNDLRAGLVPKAVVVNQKKEVKSDGHTRVRFSRMG
jgi:ribosomal protein L14